MGQSPQAQYREHTETYRCPGGESVEEMQFRVDLVIDKVRKLRYMIYTFNIAQVREHHKQYKEGVHDTRDVIIVAHGHFSRVFIARWIEFPLRLGASLMFLIGSILR